MGEKYIYWGDCGVWRRDGGDREEGWVKYIYIYIVFYGGWGQGGGMGEIYIYTGVTVEEGKVGNVEEGWVGTGRRDG